jgi:hypothetical protein
VVLAAVDVLGLHRLQQSGGLLFLLDDRHYDRHVRLHAGVLLVVTTR